MKSLFISSLAAIVLCASCSSGKADQTAKNDAELDSLDALPTVFYFKNINSDNLVKAYELLGSPAADAKNVAVKISTGESMKSHQLEPSLIKTLIDTVHGTLIECNTAYAGNRNTTEAHRKAAEEHGYTAIAKVDIMDAEGDTILPIEGGKHLKHDIVGKSYPDYDYTLVLSHFKGHAMGGFGGALKNISIGIASSNGKAYIHSAGKTDNVETIWQNTAEQDDFLESMAEASKAVIDHAKGKIAYINVANNLSVDCDCDGDPDAPAMGDLGILASLDPVALDRACVDLVFNSEDPGKAALIERINSRHGTHTLDYAEQLGLGSQKYKLVVIE